MTKGAITGKFFLHSGADYYQTGKIVEQVGDVLFIEIDDMRGSPSPSPTSLTAIHIEEIISEPTDEGGFDVDWQFFRSRRALDAYMAWLNTATPDEGPKVVKLEPKQLN